MNDAERYTIPSRLDDPERWLFWTMDEAAVLMGPAMLGLAANAFVPGLVIGIGGWLRPAAHQARRAGRARAARRVLVSARAGAGTEGCAGQSPAAPGRLRGSP